MACIANGVARGRRSCAPRAMGSLSSEYFYRHRKHCLNETKVTLTATSSSPMSTAEPDEEWRRVLEGMKKDSAYVTITADIFAARKPNKKLEANLLRAERGCSVRMSIPTFKFKDGVQNSSHV